VQILARTCRARVQPLAPGGASPRDQATFLLAWSMQPPGEKGASMGSKKTGKGSLIVKSGIRAGSGKLATNHSRALLGHR